MPGRQKLSLLTERGAGWKSADMNWDEAEVKYIVEDYFSMLNKQLADQPVNKTEHRRTLLTKISRSAPSVEFKHRNISAVFEVLGFEFLDGYVPAKNYQRLLADVVEEFLTRGALAAQTISLSPPGFDEMASLFAEAPPEKLQDGRDLPDYIQRLARKFDPVERDLRNTELGKAGERLIFEREKELLIGSGRMDLAKKIEWTSQERGDGAGYDIRSFDSGGSEKFIEVKTTNGSKRTPFYVTENELEFSRAAKSSYCLNRLYRFRSGPRLYELSSPLEDFVALSPTVYRAEFGGG